MKAGQLYYLQRAQGKLQDAEQELQGSIREYAGPEALVMQRWQAMLVDIDVAMGAMINAECARLRKDKPCWA